MQFTGIQQTNARHGGKGVRFGGKLDAPQYEVPLTPEQALAKLRSQVDDKKLDFWSTQHNNSNKGGDPKKGFYGEIEGNAFRIMRKRWYNNGSAPLLEGKVEATPKGSKIATRWDRLPSGKWLRRGILGAAALASLITLPILGIKLAKGEATKDAAVGLVAPVLAGSIFAGVEAPLTRREKKGIKKMMDNTFNG